MPVASRVIGSMMVYLASAVAGALVPGLAFAGPVPAAIKALLPASAVFQDGSWSATATVASGNVRADIRGIESSCDITLDSEIRFNLRGSSTWNAIQLQTQQREHDSQVGKSKTSMTAAAIGRQKSGGAQITAMGSVKEESVPGGRILYFEYTENCPKRPNHPVTILEAFGRSGSMFMHAWVTATTDVARVKPLVGELLSRFQQFDPAQAK
ncbi:MAG: hypothetical protein WCP29_18635 [Acidobacteriota bacterium]